MGRTSKTNIAERSLPPHGGIVQSIGWQVWRLVFKAISPVMVFGGGYLFVSGLRIKTIAAEKLLKIRTGGPVLYLRPFSLDSYRDPHFTARTQEETLAAILRRVGPCIAVSDPNRKEVLLGFSRLKLGDGWQTRLDELIQQSRLVVLCAGGTEGLLWELRRVAELVRPRSKLLLIVTGAVTEQWWELATELLGIRRFNIQNFGFQFSYHSLIYFDESGKSYYNSLDEVGKRPRVLLEDALDPLFLQLGIRPRNKVIRTLSDPMTWAILVFVFSCLFLVTIVVLLGLGLTGN